jgi:hypothetical protein
MGTGGSPRFRNIPFNERRVPRGELERARSRGGDFNLHNGRAHS